MDTKYSYEVHGAYGRLFNTLDAEQAADWNTMGFLVFVCVLAGRA